MIFFGGETCEIFCLGAGEQHHLRIATAITRPLCAT
jgi:hypothetical protein